VVIEMGASINSRVTIGAGARVIGGAFVNTDVPDHAVVVGVPARLVRYDE
jgi:acetyltransferase-like isoleucine patch superfamily enzyme